MSTHTVDRRAGRESTGKTYMGTLEPSGYILYSRQSRGKVGVEAVTWGKTRKDDERKKKRKGRSNRMASSLKSSPRSARSLENWTLKINCARSQAWSRNVKTRERCRCPEVNRSLMEFRSICQRITVGKYGKPGSVESEECRKEVFESLAGGSFCFYVTMVVHVGMLL